MSILFVAYRKPTWIPTEISATTKTNKNKAEKLLTKYIEKYSQDSKYLSPRRRVSLEKKNSANGLLQHENKKISLKILFSEHLKQWLTNKKLEVDIITWESYQTYVEVHLIPYFEPLGLAVDEITPRHIKEYYNYKATGGRMDGKSGGLSSHSLKKHASVLRMAFKEAMLFDGLHSNPTVSVPITKGQDRKQDKHVILTADDANRLIAAADGHSLKALIYIALYYGLRKSELIGLRWQAIDFSNDTIEINFIVVKNKSIVEKAATKTKSSKATYWLIPDVKEVLLQIKQQIQENQKRCGSAYISSDFVFVKPNGQRLDPTGVYKSFVALLKNQGLPHMRIHDLRYSCASILYDKGWDMKAIQIWMRHSTSGMSLYYTQLSKNRRLIMADAINETFHYDVPQTEI